MNGKERNSIELVVGVWKLIIKQGGKKKELKLILRFPVGITGTRQLFIELRPCRMPVCLGIQEKKTAVKE